MKCRQRKFCLVQISILLLVLAGCEKDLGINEDYLTDQSLENYLSTFEESKIVEDLFAFAGKSDVFERETIMETGMSNVDGYVLIKKKGESL